MKKCGYCKKRKSLTNFTLNKSRGDGYNTYCKKCSRSESKRWRIKNPEKVKRNNEKLRKRLREDTPWYITWSNIKARCNNTKDPAYKYYGGRGIKCFITLEEVKQIWFRDKAYRMDWPSIDREDNDGNYEIGNCQFIEFSRNIGKSNSNRKQKEEVKC